MSSAESPAPEPPAPEQPVWRATAGGWQYRGGDGWWYQRDPDPKGAWWRQAPDGAWQYLAVDGQWHLPPSPAFALGGDATSGTTTGWATWGPPTTTPRPVPSPAPGPSPGPAVNTFSRLSIILGALALVFLPPVLGIAGIVLAVVAMGRREPLGWVGLVVSVVGLVAGMVIGVVVYHALHGST